MASPAKVTLQLRILGRQRDGYHAVRIAMVPVALYDRLSFDPGGSAGAGGSHDAGGIVLRAAGPAELGDAEQNLVVRAARAFGEASGQPLDLALALEKRIPVGAGLGGGSGNAAATLVALNIWHGHPIGPARLEALALALGADVPFFLDPRPAWAEGVGERLTPIDTLPPLALLVVKPALAIRTAEAYAHCLSEADGAPAPGQEPDFGSLDGVVAGLFNGFEATLLPRHPELAALKAALLEAGARGALLSGSGSAVFGVFADGAARDAAARALATRAAHEGWQLLPCDTLPRHRYDLVY